MTKYNKISMITLGLIVAASLTVSGAIAQTVLVPEPPTINTPVDTTNESISEQYLTNDEKARTLDIIKNDAQTKNILDGTEWDVKQIGPRITNSEKYGALVFIKLKEPKWVEETVTNPFSKEVSNIKSWTKSMHIAVDFNSNEVSGIDLGMTRPVVKTQIEDSRVASAESIAMQKQSLGASVDSRLVAVYETDKYPEGLAFFSVMSDDGKNEEMMVVDLSNMAIDEKYSGAVGRITP